MMGLFERVPVAATPVHVVEIDGERFYTVGGVLARRGDCKERISAWGDARREEIIKRIMGGVGV